MNDTSKLEHRELTDIQLNDVSGGKEKWELWFKGLETMLDAQMRGEPYAW